MEKPDTGDPFLPAFSSKKKEKIIQLAKWRQLLSSCSSRSVREEFHQLCSNLICIYIARKLGIRKVMISESADNLATLTLSSFTLARGLFFSKFQNRAIF